MATYKVIQDIEAEDKFLGPLTLRQFIFGASAIFFTYLSAYALTQNAGFLLVIFVPPALLGAFLAIPWNKDQPTEVWVLAKLRFRIKSKTRIWDQAGLEELVTITVPKVIDKPKTDGLNPAEVQSRLKALAETIDTRGWATKNVGLNGIVNNSGDRLIIPSMMEVEVPEVDIDSYHDVLNEDTAVSDNFNNMIQTSGQVHRQQSLDKMERARQGESVGAVMQPTINFTPPTDVYQQNSEFSESQLSQQLRNNRDAGDLVTGNLRTISTKPASLVLPVAEPPTYDPPVDDTTAVDRPEVEAQAEMTKQGNPAILDLAQNNDLNVATLARQANRNDLDDREVVISLR